MKRSHRSGLGFGITSGVITTLGLIVGLYSGTESSFIVIGGILTIAIADAFSDSLGIHVAKESVNEYSTKEVWEATFATFFSKFLMALTFVVPFLFFYVTTAVLISILWGVFVLSFFSFFIAKKRGEPAWKAITEHLFIAMAVIVITYYLPHLIQHLLV